jgi:hypothetical protein
VIDGLAVTQGVGRGTSYRIRRRASTPISRKGSCFPPGPSGRTETGHSPRFYPSYSRAEGESYAAMCFFSRRRRKTSHEAREGNALRCHGTLRRMRQEGPIIRANAPCPPARETNRRCEAEGLPPRSGRPPRSILCAGVGRNPEAAGTQRPTGRFAEPSDQGRRTQPAHSNVQREAERLPLCSAEPLGLFSLTPSRAPEF